MLLLPTDIVALLAPFAPLFSRPVWRHVQVLLVGAILAPGRRMVSSALRAVGLGALPQFQRYHRVLNRAIWSSLEGSRILLGLLVATFAADGPLVVGIDETIERRRGPKIAAAGIYRDPVRSSHSHFVTVRGLRWICLHLLVPIPWAGHVWALPFLTALAPSERSCQARHRRYKPLTLWARQLIRLVHRWQPDRRLVIVGDRTYAALELLAAVRPAATVVARLRLDAHLCAPAPAPARLPQQTGRPRLVGARRPNLTTYVHAPATDWTTHIVARWYGERDRPIQFLSATAVWDHTGLPPVPIRWVLLRDPRGKFATQAVLCTDLTVDPLHIVSWFILRWQLEVTFREVRAHLGVETQRQWSDRAIARTTPALLGLFSVVTLLAHAQVPTAASIRQSAWYCKPLPTFADALALVRRQLWTAVTFQPSLAESDLVNIPRPLLNHLADLLCYAA